MERDRRDRARDRSQHDDQARGEGEDPPPRRTEAPHRVRIGRRDDQDEGDSSQCGSKLQGEGATG